MTLTLVTIPPCREDNYAFLLHDTATGQTALADAPEAAPIRTELNMRGWTLTHILITHHHYDHVDGGVDELRAAYTPRVIGAKADAHRLPQLDMAVSDGGEVFDFAGHEVQVMDVSGGHTVGHIAYHIPPAAQAVFTGGDSLMALGCGRLFEGTAPQMWDSLSKLAALPPETQVCSGHEYTAANAAFALTIEPGNTALTDRSADIGEAREVGIPTVPSALSLELATNPFLRAHLPEVKAGLGGMEHATDAEVFAEIRARKDRF